MPKIKPFHLEAGMTADKFAEYARELEQERDKTLTHTDIPYQYFFPGIISALSAVENLSTREILDFLEMSALPFTPDNPFHYLRDYITNPNFAEILGLQSKAVSAINLLLTWHFLNLDPNTTGRKLVLSGLKKQHPDP